MAISLPITAAVSGIAAKMIAGTVADVHSQMQELAKTVAALGEAVRTLKDTVRSLSDHSHGH